MMEPQCALTLFPASAVVDSYLAHLCLIAHYNPVVVVQISALGAINTQRLVSFPTSPIPGLSTGKTQDVRLQKCQEIVENLPQPNYDVLKYLIGFTQKVRGHVQWGTLLQVPTVEKRKCIQIFYVEVARAFVNQVASFPGSRAHTAKQCWSRLTWGR